VVVCASPSGFQNWISCTQRHCGGVTKTESGPKTRWALAPLSRRGAIGASDNRPPQRGFVSDVLWRQFHGHDKRDQTVHAGVPLARLDDWTLRHASAADLRAEQRRLPNQVVRRLLQAAVHHNRDFHLQKYDRGHKRKMIQPH
jgi:hypothetical protein